MSSEPSTEDVLAKMDALLKKHQPGATQGTPAVPLPPPVFDEITPPAELVAVAARRLEPLELIPTLTDVVDRPSLAEEDSIPVLTEVVEPASEPAPPEEAPTPADLDQTLRRVEDLLVEQLENRIAPQLSASFDRALGELLESARASIQQAVHDTLARELRKQLDAATTDRADKP